MECRRLLRVIGFLCGAFSLAAVSHGDVFRLNDLAGGMNDSVPGNMIGDNEAVSITNFHINTDSRGLDQRNGNSRQNTTQLSGKVAVDVFSHVKASGSSYVISVASKTVAYSIDSGVSFTNLITTATLNAVWDGVSFLDDNFYMTNQSDGGWYFTGSGLFPAGTMPSGKFIENYQNRLFVANTAAYPYRLFFSGLLQPSTWTTTTDYIDFPEAVTAIGKPYDGGLPIYTANTTWILRGTGPTNFYLTQVSGNIGCADNRTIQNMIISGQEYQVFFSLGPNGSRKNIYGLFGDRLIPLGDKIPNLLDTVSVFDTSLRLIEWDLVSEFDDGSFSGTYADTSDESVKLSTWSATDTTGTDFLAGTLVNMDTTTTSGALTLSDPLQNLSFENGTTTNATNWTEGSSSGVIGRSSGTAAYSGTWAMAGSSDYTSVGDDCSIDQTAFPQTLGIYTSAGVLLAERTFTVTTSYQKFIASATAYSGQSIKLTVNANKDVSVGPGCGPTAYFNIATSDAFLFNGSSITFYAKAWGSGNKKIAYDLFSTLSSGTFTSQTFDTTFSSAAWTPGTVSTTAYGNSITFQTQSSSDAVNWTTAASWDAGGGASPSSAFNRYFRYIITMTTTSNSTGLPYVDYVTLNARNSSGSYTSDIRDAGPYITTWDTFNNYTSGSGTIGYYIRTATSSSLITSQPWTSVTFGTDVTGSSRFFQWKADFSITNSTHDPTATRTVQNYTTSFGASQPTGSIVWNNEYWFSFRKDSSSIDYNDTILVMNREGKFSKFTGLNVYGFGVVNRILVSGTSITDGTNGGYIRRLDIGTSDDGTAVSASVTFKHHEFPSMNDYRKTVGQAYLSYGVTLGTFTVTALENFSEESTSYTVRFATGTDVGRWKLEMKPGTSCKQFGLKFDNSYLGSQLNIYPPLTIHFQQQKLIPEGSSAP